MIVVDSSVWIDWFEGTETLDTPLLDNLPGAAPEMTNDLILPEILRGFLHARDARGV